MINYLIGFDSENKHHLGTDFTQRSTKKSFKGLCSDAMKMRRAQPKIAKVFVLSAGQYTQKVCEMSPNEFTEYVQRVGARVS